MKTTLKTFALVGALGLGAAAMAVAQPEPGRGRHSVEDRVAHMRESLGLSDDQAARIETILKDAAAKRETGTERRNREGFRQQREDVRSQIDAVLTPEQREKRDKIAAERKAKGGRRGGRRER